MHTRELSPLLHLCALFGGSIFGPYVHGGRDYLVWQLRGPALRRVLPLFDVYLPPSWRREQYLAWRRRWFAHVPFARAGDPSLSEFL